MSEKDFLPQAISFGKAAAASVRAADFGPAHTALQTRLQRLAADSPWKPLLEQDLSALESEVRRQWLSEWLMRIRTAFTALVEQIEDPTRWRAPESEACRQKLLGELNALRKELQTGYLGLLPAGREQLQQLQRFVTAQLTKLDALQLRNASAYEKSREAAAAIRAQLQSAGALPEELLALAELDRLLDTAVRYQFAWDVALSAKGELEHHLTALQQIAINGLRPPPPPPVPAIAGMVWSWREDQLCNDLGVPLRALKGGYQDWMKRGLAAVQQAAHQHFASGDLLLEALEAFYCAHSAARERPEALVALAWLLTLLQKPVQAVDCLELALRREAMPEIKELFWQIQALDPANQPKKPARKPRPARSSEQLTVNS